jgi:hypothetical protein
MRRGAGRSAAGRKWLAENGSVVDDVNARLRATVSARSQLDAPQIVGAMQSQKTALRLRTGDSELSAAQVLAVAAALDAAAADIERLRDPRPPAARSGR